MTLRVIFMGTPDFSVPTLRAIAQAGHDIAAVYTQPPRPAGRRGLETIASPVQRLAEELGIEVRTPISLKGAEEQAAFSALKADVVVVVAYGLLLPEPILTGARLGCLNGHASLLPRWRGAAPIQRAIMAGDRQTGMMVMKMEKGLDTGPVALSRSIDIRPDMTAGELHDVLSDLGAALMAEALEKLEKGDLRFAAQPEDGVTYARKIEKSESRIDWALPAQDVHNRIRGLSPFPGAWCEVSGERVKLLRSAVASGKADAGVLLDDELTVACADGAVRLVQVQKAGGKPMPARDFLRGAKLSKGMKLS